VYFVDREKIEEILVFMERQLLLLKEMTSINSSIEKAALERAAQTVIESILDTGNAMIDGFIMRDPGSYEDIVDILTDEKVIGQELSDHLKIIIAYRKMLVQQYASVDHESLKESFTLHMKDLESYPPCVRNYLEHELGPVSAFRK